MLLTAALPAHAPPAGRIPGNKAMWVGIFCEVTEFSLMFLVYFVARAHHPEAFAAGPGRLSLLAGTGYTLMLLTSGWCVARALHAMRASQPQRCLRWLAAAFVFGLGYPLVKRLGLPPVRSALLLSLAPSVAQLVWFYPRAGDGLFGVDRGLATPLVVLALNALWGWVLARSAVAAGHG